MSCIKSSKLKKFVLTCTNDELFEESLSSSVFKTFLEVLRNVSNGKLKKCFSSSTRHKAKKYKKLIKKLLNGKKRLKTRKKLFLETSSSFQRYVYNFLLRDFMKNCVSCDNE